jgi:hypothetical protein
MSSTTAIQVVLTATPVKPTITLGEKIQITGKLSDLAGSPIANKDIRMQWKEVTASGVVWHDCSSNQFAVTKSDGAYVVWDKPSSVGTYTCRVVSPASADYLEAISTEIAFTVQPTAQATYSFIGWYVGGNKVDAERATVTLGDTVELRVKIQAGSKDVSPRILTVEFKKDIPPWMTEAYLQSNHVISLKASESTTISATFKPDEATGGRVRSYFFKLYNIDDGVNYDPKDWQTRECVFVSQKTTTTTTTQLLSQESRGS